MSDGLFLTLEGMPLLEEVVSKLEGNLDETAILDEAGAIMFNRIRTRFLSQLTPDLQKWDVSKAALHRAKIGRGGGTLYDTGRLYQSIQLFAIGSDSRAIGTDVPYAIDHNEGINGQKRREFLGFGDADFTIASQIVLRRIQEAIK